MKVLKDLYGFVFGKSKPNKKRKLTPPSERPKNAYLKYCEYGLISKDIFEGNLHGKFEGKFMGSGNWIHDQKDWRKYFKKNKDLVMISIRNAEKMANVVSNLNTNTNVSYGMTAGTYLKKDNVIVGHTTIERKQPVIFGKEGFENFNKSAFELFKTKVQEEADKQR